MNELRELFLRYKGKRASVNQKDSEHYGWLVIDVEPNVPPEKSVSIIEEVTEKFLILNYFDAKEMHYLLLEKIIKVNVVLRTKGIL